MIEAFEYKGDWWLPDKPEKQISGTLSFGPNAGAVLDLIGSFADGLAQSWNGIFQPDIILGYSSGKPITLWKCFETRRTPSSGGGWSIVNSAFRANRVFVGAHFQKEEDIKFKTLSTHYSHLDEWVAVHGFDIDLKGLPHGEFIITYRRPDPIQVPIGDDYKASIQFSSQLKVNASEPSFVQKEASIKQETWVKIESSEEKSFEDYLNAGRRIQDFLSLATGEPAYPLAIVGTTEANKTTMGHYPDVEVFYRLSSVPVVSKTLIPPYISQ